MGEILVGTASWTDPTLIKSGRFYPAWARTAETRLKFYASQFRLVEVDSTYYSLPSEENSRLWVQAHRPRTSSSTSRPSACSPSTRRRWSACPRTSARSCPPQTGKTNLYQRDLPEELVSEVWQRFEEALAPLGRGRASSASSSSSSRPGISRPTRHSEYILACKEKLPQYRLAVEFRHNSWLNEKNRERTLAFLRRTTCPSSASTSRRGSGQPCRRWPKTTADIGLVRFHGRNIENWEKKGLTAVERFNYLYSEAELAEWVPRNQGDGRPDPPDARPVQQLLRGQGGQERRPDEANAGLRKRTATFGGIGVREGRW